MLQMALLGFGLSGSSFLSLFQAFSFNYWDSYIPILRREGSMCFISHILEDVFMRAFKVKGRDRSKGGDSNLHFNIILSFFFPGSLKVYGTGDGSFSNSFWGRVWP